MTKYQKFQKRSFDILFSFIGLILTGWLILISFIIATIDTRLNGFFIQKRVGKNGKLFLVIKIRSMRSVSSITTTVTTAKDPRISTVGRFFRKTKLDELPQLINVLIGNMSFVGPRPDVPGFADKLTGNDRRILELRPGITGPASVYFKNEEEILAVQEYPEKYNLEVIWPKKVRLNLEYLDNYSLLKDIRCIIQTL